MGARRANGAAGEVDELQVVQAGHDVAPGSLVAPAASNVRLSVAALAMSPRYNAAQHPNSRLRSDAVPDGAVLSAARAVRRSGAATAYSPTFHPASPSSSRSSTDGAVSGGSGIARAARATAVMSASIA